MSTGPLLKVGIRTVEPLVYPCVLKHLQNSAKKCPYPGIDVEYFRRLSLVSAFNFTLVPVREPVELFVSNGTVDTIIYPFPYVYRLAPSLARLQWSIGVNTPRVGLLYKKEVGNMDAPFWYLAPFQQPLWLVLLSCLLCFTITLLLVHRFIIKQQQLQNRKQSGLLWYGLVTLFNQYPDVTLERHSWRILIIAWQMAVFLLNATYSGILISFLLQASRNDPMSSFEDLLREVERGTYRIVDSTTQEVLDALSMDNITWEYTLAKAFFPTHLEDKAVQVLQEHPVELMMAPKQSVGNWADAILEKVRQGGYVTVNEAKDLHLTRNCDPNLIVRGLVSLERPSAYMFHRNFTYAKLINEGILALENMNIHDRLTEKYWKYICNDEIQAPEQQAKITIRHCLSIVSLYGVGMVVSGALLALEVARQIWHKKSAVA